MKRLVDFVVSLFLLIILLPSFVLIVILIRRDSPGPAIFRQVRVGRAGRTFTMLKFRTMVEDAGERGPFNTAPDDPRITRIGRFLRRTSLDELPQLINVALGDMSLVGPRPEVPIQRQFYGDEEWEARHTIRPGITGLAQIRGRSVVSPERRKALDLEYVRSRGTLLDIRIMIWTAGHLFRGW